MVSHVKKNVKILKDDAYAKILPMGAVDPNTKQNVSIIFLI